MTGCYLLVERYTGHGEDRHRNQIDTWAEEERVAVIAIAPSQSSQTSTQDRPHASIQAWDVYAPVGTRIDPRDRMSLPGIGRVHLVGGLQYWCHNPHALFRVQGGIQFRIERRAG